jgi:hypothetical protein
VSAEWPAVRHEFGRLRLLTPSEEVTAVDLRAEQLSSGTRRARKLVGGGLVLIGLVIAAALFAAALFAGCGAGVTVRGDRYLVEYALISAEGNCPPYAPESLTVGPRVTDLRCTWVPLEGELGLNLLCSAESLPVVTPLSWDAETWTGSARIDYLPTCSGTYAVTVRRIEQ